MAMDFSSYLYTSTLNEKALLKRGFLETDDGYILNSPIDGGLYIKILISKDSFKATPYDEFSDEEFVLNGRSSFRLGLEEQIKEMVEAIVKECFINISPRQKVFDYVKEKYQIDPVKPFTKDIFSEIDALYTKENHKWFALFMRIKAKSLNIDEEGEVETITLKAEPEDIVNLIDNKSIFPAYHMNKKHWICVLLDSRIEDDKLFALIDASHSLSQGNSKKMGASWVIPSNVKIYDVINMFDKDEIRKGSKTSYWTQSKGIKKGDTVYIYVGSPYSSIMFKTTVRKTNIEVLYPGQDKPWTMMEIRLEKKIPQGKYSLERLKAFGLEYIRGPRHIPKALEEELISNKD